MRPISLHHIVTPDISAVELVALAGALGCPHVCVFTEPPPPSWPFPCVTDENIGDVLAAMQAHDVSAYGVTSFPIAPQTDVTAFEGGLARGGRLGATYASVRIADPDEARATDNFGRLCDIAGRHGLEASIEMMAYDEPEALDRTLRIIAGAGKGKLTLDPLHLVRSGASLDAIRKTEPSPIGYFQICDGPAHASADDYWRSEGGAERLAPGEGDFPLEEMLTLVTDSRPVSIEVPCQSLRARGLTPEARARRAVDATRRFLAVAEP
jgi:sugar phosphate isomerase/epimerase